MSHWFRVFPLQRIQSKSSYLSQITCCHYQKPWTVLPFCSVETCNLTVIPSSLQWDALSISMLGQTDELCFRFLDQSEHCAFHFKACKTLWSHTSDRHLWQYWSEISSPSPSCYIQKQLGKITPWLAIFLKTEYVTYLLKPHETKPRTWAWK